MALHSEPQPGEQSGAESDIVFNLTWTGDVFKYQHYFLDSLLTHSAARFRFLLNACSSSSIDEMRAYAEARPSRIVELVEVSSRPMISHGAALQIAFDQQDDGEFFSFIDTDILAKGPFVADFITLMDDVDVVTSGTEVWSDGNVMPADAQGVSGEYFFGSDGFVFGSPHCAIYRREALRALFERWGFAFDTGGQERMSKAAWELISSTGQTYWMYDTAKIVNIALQAEGHRLEHSEHPNLVHIGGLAHYLAPPGHDSDTGTVLDGQGEDPPWTSFDGQESRADVARFAAKMLVELTAGRSAPEVPSSIEDSMAAKLQRVRAELTEIVSGPSVEPVMLPLASSARTADLTRPYFFVHLMKTAGTSVNRHITANFATDEIYPGSDDLDGGDYWVIEHLREAVAADDGQIRIWAGHFPFFVTDLVPDAVTMTLLRDPVERIVSLLGDYQRKEMPDLSLEEIYDDPIVFGRTVHDHQTKIFSMTEEDDVKAWTKIMELGPERLDRAKDVIGSIDILGFQEEFEGFLATLSDRWGWTIETRARANVGVRERSISNVFRRRIIAENVMDMELYEYARGLTKSQRSKPRSRFSRLFGRDDR
ncbi:MAG: hypothetical protein IH940_07720 [Acidobacteria bacterium]|nr:hypothetical protein [Acidobacteriota bacterium]